MSWLESFSNAIKSSIASKLDKNEAGKIFAKKSEVFDGDYANLKNKPAISQAGLSGDYKDLNNKPLSHLQLDVRDTEYLIDQDGKRPILDAIVSENFDDTIRALGWDEVAEEYYVYTIDPNAGDGLFCLRYGTNLTDIGLKHGYDEETGNYLPNPKMFFVYFSYPHYEDRMILIQEDKMFMSTSYETIDSKHINVLFDKYEWPIEGVVSEIKSATLYNQSSGNRERFVVIVEKPSSGRDLQASSYYSEDFVNWTPGDLYIKEKTGTYDVDTGYKQLIKASIKYDDSSDPYKTTLIAWNEYLDEDHKMAYTTDGISWEYVPSENLPYLSGYITDLGSSVLFITSSGKLYVSRDLLNWEFLSDPSISAFSPDFVHISESYSEFGVDTLLTVVNGFMVAVVKNMKEKVCSIYVPYLGDGYYISDFAFMDYSLTLRMFSRERDDDNRDTGNVLYDSFLFGITTSSDVPEDVTAKVASYVSGYINTLPEAPSSDGAYNLKCEVVDGVPTYTWEEVTEYETLEGGDY